MVDFGDLTEEQQRAADALDRNVTLTAGAGTGKTTTLTQRYMQMLERGLEDDVPEDPEAPLLPDEIVTTTFTERAANELKANVREAINERVADADAEKYRQWRDVADGLEEGYIHTLHGFCARILREHALSASTVDPGFDTLEESETRALLEETVAAVLETHDDHEAVRRLSRQFTRSGLQDVLVDLLQERPGSHEWARTWADATEAEYLTYVNEELHPVPPALAAERFADPAFCEAVAAVEDLVDSPPSALETGGTAWDRAVDVLDCLEGVDYREARETLEVRDAFIDLCDILTKGDGDEYKSYTGANTRWSGAVDEKATFDDAIKTIVDTVEPADHLVDGSIEVDRTSFPFVQALAELTLLAHEEYIDRKRRQNVVDFTDQIEFALQFLRDEASESLRQDLREQFTYLMVDEFQDTDPRQWELIKHLTAPDPTRFDARNVFVVGDTKQSIYRFRNADVTQFDATERELERANPSDGGARDDNDDQLSTNFRTLPGVLAFINELFDEVFEEGGPAYEAEPQRLTAHRDDPDGIAAMEYLAVPTDEAYRARRFDDDHDFATARVEHDAELEGMALAARLTQLFDEPAQVYDEDGDVDDPEARDLQPDDVAILLRSRTHLKKYERALEAADVPFTVASGVGFYETPEVTALVNLLTALADPADERALYGALRSPLFGIPDDTLALLKRDGDPLWEALREDDADELADAHELLTSWRGQAGLGSDPEPNLDGSWAAYLSRIIDETGYLASVSADERGRQAVANVDKFREQLRAYSEDGVTSLATLVDRIERHREIGAGEGEATIQGGGDGVQILTVHDAKGMEFPVVVVPGLSKGFNMRAAVGDGRVEFEQLNQEYAIGLKGPDPEDAFEMKQTVAREALKERRTAEERAEEKRILYVACTRARDRLLLSGTHDLDGDDGSATMADVEAADPDDAGSWRDWVQPHVLTDAVLDELEGCDRVTRTLGDATVTVSLPTPSADWTDGMDAPDPQLELSESPSQPPLRFQLSPTDLASLFDDWGSLYVDEWTNTVRYQSEDDDPENQSGEGTGSDTSKPTDLESTVFGEIVHRICELRPPEDRWDDIIARTHEAEDSEVSLTDPIRDRIRQHVTRATTFVDQLHDRSDVEYTYDELEVTAAFDRGEVSGLIDHLLVTPDTYHVVDYKTNDIDEGAVEAKGEYYQMQLAAYAVALHQQDADRDVIGTLYFTSPETAYRIEWSPTELDELEDELARRIVEQFPDR